MLGEEDPAQPRSFARSPKLWRIGILLAGSTMNLIAAAVFFSIAYTAGWPTVTQARVEIFRVVPASPAEQAGLQKRRRRRVAGRGAGQHDRPTCSASPRRTSAARSRSRSSAANRRRR